jgi:NTP pyrophosphatase (non-canonical NTP hydrolase)
VSGRLVLLASSPRVSPGLLTRDAWRALDDAAMVWARATDEPLAEAVGEAGVEVTALPDELAAPPAAARHLVGQAMQGYAVWLVSADADPGLTDAIAAEVSRLDGPPEVEVLVGSWDAPGSRLLDVVAIMDRLRSPGGCPWDAKQTHQSLVKYLVEEAHEAAEAIERGDREHMAEELGDVLLQVVFQSRVAQEHPTEPFDIDVVAGLLVEKLVRRHPHVFSDVDASTPEEVESNWELIKAEEKAAKAVHLGGEGGHESLLHGIPASLSTLLAAEKVLARWERAGNDLSAVTSPADPDELGGSLLALVARAREQGESADALLRAALRDFR